MKLRSLLLTLFAWLTILSIHAKKPASYSDAIKWLIEAIDDNEQYVSQRLAHIDSLKAMTNEDATSAMLYGKIGDELKGVDVDSAIAYYQKGRTFLVVIFCSARLCTRYTRTLVR